MIFLQIAIIIGFPYLARTIAKNSVSWMSPVVLCYTFGIILANLSILELNESIANYFTQGTILLAIPFLLFATDLSSWLSDFKGMVLSFLLCVFAGIIGNCFAGWYFQNTVENSWLISGMIAAIFSGGIPNMQSVGMALEAPSNTIVLINAADIFIGGIYLIFLTSVAHKFLGFFLKNYDNRNSQMSKNNFLNSKIISYKDFIKGLGIALLIIGISVGTSFLFYGHLAATFIILSLTTLSILASRLSVVKKLEGTFEVGDYLLLMFCAAVGMLANFNNILENGLNFVLFMAIAWGFTVCLHWLLCYLLKIDKDTAIIASTAAIYGPVFIGQIASTIGNRKLVFPGIALGLLGIALGNYVGIFVAWLLR